MFVLICEKTEHEYEYGGWNGNKTKTVEVIAVSKDEKLLQQRVEQLKKDWPRLYGNCEFEIETVEVIE